MKFIFAGGGTGGHVFPAIAIADELKKMIPNSEILFIGAKARIEERLIPQYGYGLKTISVEGFKRGSILSNTKLPVKIVNAILKSKKILKEFNPDVVIGTGGFVSLPVLYAAVGLKKRTLIQEGNYYPGLATRFLSSRVNKVVVNFTGTKDFFKRKDNVIKIGHPVRSSLEHISRYEAITGFGLDPTKFTLFVFGGSQGAKGINSAVESNIDDLLNLNINLIWQTGKNEHDRLYEKFIDRKNVKVMDFINDMSAAYSASDLVLCRSGITSIMEIAYLGKAVIFVPFPGATDNHQEKNARSLEKENAAKVLLEPELESKIVREVKSLIGDEIVLHNLQSNIKKFEDHDASKKIAEEILKIAQA